MKEVLGTAGLALMLPVLIGLLSSIINPYEPTVRAFQAVPYSSDPDFYRRRSQAVTLEHTRARNRASFRILLGVVIGVVLAGIVLISQFSITMILP